MVELVQPTEWRIKNLVDAYSGYERADLSAAFTRLRKRLGGQHLQRALDALAEGDYAAAARIALVYYDKTYAHYAERKNAEEVVRLDARAPDPASIAEQILALS